MAAEVTRVDAAPTAAAPDVAFVAPQRTLLGWGIHRVIEIPAPWSARARDLRAALDELDGGGPPATVAGTGAVGFAALPFDRRAPGRLVVPRVLWTRLDDGTQYVSRLDAEPPEAGSAGAADPGPTAVRFEVEQPVAQWCESVASARDRILAGELAKVVLARRLIVTADRPWDAAQILDRLSARHPHSYRYLVDGFVGASPELLVSRIGDVVRARPMAGTLPRSGDVDRDAAAAAALMASEKNRAEHAITIDAVHDALLEWCSYLDSEPVPRVVDAGSVQHLATPLEGRLHEPGPDVAELVAALHPTPAVGGHPRSEALRLIEELEPFERGRYGGPVGWVDRLGDGAWAVGIRGAEIHGATAVLSAGVGVVADSDPVAELAETRAKFAATTGAFLDL